MKTLDPGRMTCDERLTEIAEILAVACQRYFANECKVPAIAKNSEHSLDVLDPVEAPCARVQSPKSRTA